MLPAPAATASRADSAISAFVKGIAAFSLRARAPFKATCIMVLLSEIRLAQKQMRDGPGIRPAPQPLHPAIKLQCCANRFHFGVVFQYLVSHFAAPARLFVAA